MRLLNIGDKSNSVGIAFLSEYKEKKVNKEFKVVIYRINIVHDK